MGKPGHGELTSQDGVPMWLSKVPAKRAFSGAGVAWV